MKPVDLAVFFLYLAGVVLYGSSFYRKNKSAASFTLGNNNIPAWAISMSIFATYVSSISYLAIPGQAYQSDWNPFVFSLSIPLATYLAVRYFVPLYRSVGSPSAYTYLELRFGKWASMYASTMYLLTQVMRTGTILFLMALMLQAMTGWNLALIIIFTGVSVMVYSLLGGIQAVVWTDAVQAIVMLAGALACAGVLLFSMPEGPGQLFRIAGEHHKFSLGSFSLRLDSATFWVVLIYGIVINLQNYGIDQNYVQRYMTASSVADAKLSVMFGGLLYIPVSMLFLFIGTGLFVYYQVHAGLLPQGLQADKVFPWFIVHSLPRGLTGLLVASVFAAGMSTMSTSINSAATVILNNYLKGISHMADNTKRPMGILYASSFLFSILGIMVGMAMVNVQSVLDTWWKLASVFSGGMLGLFLLGYFTKKVSNVAAIAGVSSGVLLIGWMSLSPLLPVGIAGNRMASPFHNYLSIVFGTMVIFIAGFLCGIWINRFNRRKTATSR